MDAPATALVQCSIRLKFYGEQVARMVGNAVRLDSRTGKNLTSTYPELSVALAGRRCVSGRLGNDWRTPSRQKIRVRDRNLPEDSDVRVRRTAALKCELHLAEIVEGPIDAPSAPRSSQSSARTTPTDSTSTLARS